MIPPIVVGRQAFRIVADRVGRKPVYATAAIGMTAGWFPDAFPVRWIWISSVSVTVRSHVVVWLRQTPTMTVPESGISDVYIQALQQAARPPTPRFPRTSSTSLLTFWSRDSIASLWRSTGHQRLHVQHGERHSSGSRQDENVDSNMLSRIEVNVPDSSSLASESRSRFNLEAFRRFPKI
ncbi:hypothetical protein F5Y00DRAFT_215070 [Daldinia vernicosa]|uniref:uncharacterized protein n=1 Tax=Daldinia vernicosa TaxID=114800 RepID=UPI002008117E|nr:uncharacterized protein F5Y00DRAFT_215070 [Daldinia vernicosa]KAI0851677.1 hypothetical protein F5Y00DRAFT_215070 [Daldinia vernicosa]